MKYKVPNNSRSSKACNDHLRGDTELQSHLTTVSVITTQFLLYKWHLGLIKKRLEKKAMKRKAIVTREESCDYQLGSDD